METRYDSWAGVYDSIYSYVREDIPFYVEAAQAAGGPVLELGCGTGRVTMPIAEAGVDVVGLDSSAAMLNVARRKLGSLSPGSGSVTLVEGDMAELPGAYDQKFSLAIIPFRGFLSLMTVPKQESVLEGIRRSLIPGGRLVFNVFVPDLEMLVQEGDTAHHLRDVTDPETGDRFVIWHQSGYDNHNQVIFVRLIVDQLELPLQHLHQPVRGGGLDLQAHRVALAPVLQLLGDLLQQIVGLFIHVEIAVPGGAE